MDSSLDNNILDRKESVYNNKNKLAVSIMDFITIIYNCKWILLIIISKTLSNIIKRNIKRIYYLCLLNRIDNERFCNKKVS